jgi:hypothetical protein
MGDAATPFTLVSLTIDGPVLSGGGHGAFGTVKFSAPAPDGISIEVVSSNPDILSVDNSPVGADAGTNESFLILLSPQRPGKVVLTATFGNSVQAEVSVEKDPKEGKEGKEGKDGGKDHKDQGKELEVKMHAYGDPAILMAAGNLGSEGQAANGRAFIRSDERPAVRLRVGPDKKKSADAGDRRQPL